MFKHILVTAIFLATIANASASLIGPTTVFHRRLFNDLQNNIQRRQTSGSGNTTIPLSAFPSECQSGCAPAVNAINTCQTNTCLCAADIESSLQTCLDCVLKSSAAANLSSAAEQVAAAYNGQCAGTGISSISLDTTATANGTATATATDNTSTTVSSPATTSGLTQTNVPSVTSTPTATIPTVTSAPATTSKASGASATSAHVGLLTLAVTFLAALMA